MYVYSFNYFLLFKGKFEMINVDKLKKLTLRNFLKVIF